MSTLKNTHRTTISDNALSIEEVIVEDESKVTTGAVLDIDSCEEVVEPAIGHHAVHIEEWDNVPEQWIEPNDDKEHSADQIRHIDAHLELMLRDIDSGLLYRKNVYSASLPGMLKSMNRQTLGGLGGKKASACLNYFKSVKLDIWAVWNKERERIEIFFFDLEAYQKAQAEKAKQGNK